MDVAAVISVLPFDRGQVILSQPEVLGKDRTDPGPARKPAMAPVTAGAGRIPATAAAPGSMPSQTGDLTEPTLQLEALRQLGFPEVVAASALDARKGIRWVRVPLADDP